MPSRLKMSSGSRDPTANELVQRYRLSSSASLSSATTKRPSLTARLVASTGALIPSSLNVRFLLQVLRGNSSVISSADAHGVVTHSLSRNCVSSLHQNVRSLLLYGKNNVAVASLDGNDTLKGYLSLHQEAANVLTIKWVPNNGLMHSVSQPCDRELSPKHVDGSAATWKDAIIIHVPSIIYIHLHQRGVCTLARRRSMSARRLRAALLQTLAGPSRSSLWTRTACSIVPSNFRPASTASRSSPASKAASRPSIASTHRSLMSPARVSARVSQSDEALHSHIMYIRSSEHA